MHADLDLLLWAARISRPCTPGGGRRDYWVYP